MTIKHSFCFILFASFLFVGCIGVSKEIKVESTQTHPINVREYSIQSVLWQQNAAEYRALCYQAFTVAKMRLDNFLAENKDTKKPLAIITDVDETVLNNSPFNAKLIELNENYSSEEWATWVKLEKAKAIPGAEDFLNYAKEKGVEVFYVSNRSHKLVAETIANMKKVNFPYADRQHLFFKKETSAKKARFEQVRDTHKVVLYLGDNLGDFSSKFRVPSTEKRNALADSLQDEFGKRFIVLPNPMYGDWESKGLYQGRYDWTQQQKDSIWSASLKSY